MDPITKETFGSYMEEDQLNHTANGSQEFLKVGFSPTSIPLQQRWRNNGLSADFLADYLATFFPGEDDEALEKQTEIRDAVSYIANELLENAMKFSYTPSQQAVSIGMLLEKDEVRFYVTNSIDPDSVAEFQQFIEKLLSEDPSELYMEQLMNNAEDEESEGGGLGFLTMLNDYGANLAWKFQPSEQNPDTMTVTTLVKLSI